MTITVAEIQATGLPLTDHGALAEALSVGRIKLAPTEIGIGTLLETLGLSTGNALLDYLKGTPDFRHVWPLLEQGRLRADSPMVRATIDALAAGGLISVAEAGVLKALAEQPDPVTSQDVTRALEGM